VQDRSFLEAKSEVEEQVPWLRNIFISGYAGYDRQLLPGEDIPWLRCGPGSFNKRRVNSPEPFKRCSHLSENLF